MEISDLNLWWKSGKIEEEYEKAIERPILKQIRRFIDERQILTIVGLRRTGKTTLFHQIIKGLLKEGTKKENILYYNFDMGAIELDELIKKFEETTGAEENERRFIFLDEIHKLNGWNNKLKLVYDLNKNIKFFISGSSSLFIEKRTKESLAGRAFSFQLNPLTFKEFLLFKNFKLEKNINLWKKELRRLFVDYLKTGGFPELFNEGDNEKIKVYIKESIIDRIIYIDIPQVFRIEEPELLIKLMNIISSNPGAILDFNSLADDLDRNRKTISSYLFYLEKAFLIKKFYNFSTNVLTSEKKAKRFYPSSTAFAYFFNVEIPKLVENSVANAIDTKFFYRKQDKEVDFIRIKESKEIEAIEVKYKEKLRKDDFRGLSHFFRKFNKKFKIKLFLITKELEEKANIEKNSIKKIPAWKWLLEQDSR